MLKLYQPHKLSVMTQDKPEISLIVPAAGAVRNAMGVQEATSPLFRIGHGATFLDIIVERLSPYRDEFFEVLIGVEPNDLDRAKYLLSRHSNFEATFVKITDSQSAMETTMQLLRQAHSTSRVCVLLGDTAIDFPIKSVRQFENGVAVDMSEGTGSAFDHVFLDPTQKFASKSIKAGFDIPAAQVGFYWFNPNKMSIHEAPNDFLDLIGLAARDQVMHSVIAENWIDADRSHKFNEALDTAFESRSFNKVLLDRNTMMIRKTSTSPEKLVREFSFVESLPTGAASFFPTMRDLKVTENEAAVLMDYWPFPNLSDLYCFGDMPSSFWDSAFQSLASGLDSLHNAEVSKVDQVGESPSWPFIEKTLDRLDSLRHSQIWNIDPDKELVINGKSYDAASRLVEQASIALDWSVLERSVVHGDFCFSNILLDPSSLVMKFVDPRGGFSEAGLLGPKLYDFGKIAHSVYGNYDLILKGFFDLKRPNVASDGEWQLNVHEPAHAKDARQSADYYFFSQKGIRAKALLASGLILLSIPPLHWENMSRAEALFLRGIEQTASSLEALGKKKDI